MKRIGWLLLCLVLLTVMARAESAQEPVLTRRGLALGESHVWWPCLESWPEEETASAVNARLMEAAQASPLTAELAATLSGDLRICEDYEALFHGDVLSVAFHRERLWQGNRSESVWTAVNVDLLTGEAFPLTALFEDAAAGTARLEELLREDVAPLLSGYLARAELLPLPEDFALSPDGLTLYYPASQFTTLSGFAGAVSFNWAELEDVLDLSEGGILSRAGIPPRLAFDPAALLEEAAGGSLPGIPARLGDGMEDLIDQYALLADPDLYQGGRYVELEDSRFRGVLLMTDSLREKSFDGSRVLGIRADRFGQFGLVTGLTPRTRWLDALGEPAHSVVLDEETAETLRLPAGISDYYPCGTGSLRLHADGNGILYAVFLLP